MLFTPQALTALAACGQLVHAACPLMTGEELPAHHPPVRRQAYDSNPTSTEEFLSKFEINDQDTYLTSDVGGPISDQESLSAGERGPTLLEDFVFRQKVDNFIPSLTCIAGASMAQSIDMKIRRENVPPLAVANTVRSLTSTMNEYPKEV